MRKQILLILSLFLTSVGSSQSTATITIKAKKSKGDTIYLQRAERGKQVVADKAVFNFWGKAKLKTEVKEAGFFQLSKDLTQGIPLVLTGGEEINVTTTKEIYKDYTVEGSKDSELLHEYFRVKNDSVVTKDSLGKYAEKFIEENNESLAIFIALGEIKDQKKYFAIAEKGIGKAYPNSDYHKALQQAVAQLNKKPIQNKPSGIGIGEQAPELNFPSPSGEIITLESLRGKYVLIDFWASWCGPCRRENPNVVKVYEKYKDAGFEVYSVSLDKSKSRWEAAIEKDGLIWPSHVSDLKQWRSSAVKTYGFGGIPYTVLIDKEGKVIATRLRGVALEKKLEEIFEF